MAVFTNYGQELEHLREQYEEQKDNPPIPRNAPPVSGNIAWARQLLRRAEEPMKFFRDVSEVMADKDAKPIIRNYNKLAKALLQFEMVWHQGWCQAVTEAKAGLQATLLVRHPQTKQMFVNFDLDVLKLLRETKALQRLELEVPATAISLTMQENKLKSYADQLTHMLRRYYAVLGAVPDIYKPMVVPQLDDLLDKIKPGLVTYTWMSLNIESYVATVFSAMSALEDIVNKANGTPA